MNYVSLPRYKKSRQIKQFGFVEFDDKEAIQQAINCFKKVDGVLQYTSLKAENLLSIATHEKGDEEPADKTEENPTKDEGEEESSEPPAKKSRVEPESETVEVVEPAIEPSESSDVTTDVSMSEENKEPETAEDDAKQPVEGETPADESAKKKKKNRQHKKKPAEKAFFDERIMAMKIMRKKEWKKMRNSYLNLERQKAKEIKKILRDSYNKRNNNKVQESQKYSPATTASPRINFYGSPNDREDPMETPVELHGDFGSQASGLTFTPNVIVNIKFREPCLEFKELKKEFKQYAFVNYVDISEGGAQAFIRVDTPNSAQELVNQYSSCEYETEILKDEVEKEYWKKIFERRDSKKMKEQPKKEQPAKRRRGREKLLEKINKAAQHIRFEENEDVVE